MSDAAPIDNNETRARRKLRRRFAITFTIREGIRGALSSIRAHAFRSFLTALGIIIGVASVVAMVSVLQGVSYTIDQQFQGLGSNSMTIQSAQTFEAFLSGRQARVTPEDYELIRYRIEDIEYMTPILYYAQFGGQVRSGSLVAGASILGTTYTYQDVAQYYTQSGRFVSHSDEETRRRVATIGTAIRDDLDLPENPVGEYIRIGDEWIRVIGLLEERGDILGQNLDNLVILPYSTVTTMLGSARRPNIQIQLAVAAGADIARVRDQIRRVLRNAHGLRANEDDDFNIQTADELTATLDTIIGTVTLAMTGIISISLLVGGIGIMNIMLVSVTERTREIGICKAIGAKRHHILLQFLLEAVSLCLIGGIAGVLIGFGIGTLVAALIPGFPPAYIPTWAVGLALGFSAMIGIVFGILPAAKAARLDPITALRYE